MPSQGFEIVANAMNHCTTCDSLNVSYNGITKKSMPAIARLIGTNHTIDSLDFTGNRIWVRLLSFASCAQSRRAHQGG